MQRIITKMDEDDGLLLNFAAPSSSEPTGNKAKKSGNKVTGGRWKDRRKLQLSLQGRGRNQKKEKIVATGVNSTDIDNSRLDRAKESLDTAKEKPAQEKRRVPTNQDHLGPSSKRIKFKETSGEFGGKNSSYVSSLFTSNEASSTLTPTDTSAATTTYLPSNAPLKDATTFDGLGLNDKLATHLTESLRFKAPTKVQRSVIPSLIATQRDLFVKAQTGSGKTLSFLLPIFHKLMSEEKYKITRESGLFAIILVPTRELCTQIYGVLETLVRCHHHIVPGIVIGGEKKKSEKARLRKGVNILVATPGRLADHMENTTSLDVSQLRWLILDEGDRLTELGFEETITKITDNISKNSKISETIHKYQGLPTERVNVLCSATIQDNVKKLGNMILNNPETISVDSNKQIEGTLNFDDEEEQNNFDSNNSEGKRMSAPDQLIQKILVVPPKLRLVALSAMLKKLSKETNSLDDGVNRRTIVFFSCSDSLNFHFDVFTRNGNMFKKRKNRETDKFETVEVPYYSKYDNEDDNEEDKPSILTAPILGSNSCVYKLHGSLSQQQRATTLQAFIKEKNEGKNSAKHSILFCTDVASRGLDLPNISSVIEYDPPFSVEDHLHRIGRSARVGNEGSAVLFLLPGNEEGYVDGKIRVVHPKEDNLRIISYEDVLKEGFAEPEEDQEEKKASTKPDPKKRFGKWDIHATTWHLDVERWLLEDSTAHDRAVQAFTSHIRAYATHLSTERSFFNVKLLHLGHLAKSFGLRETPKKLGKSVGGNTGLQDVNNSKKIKKEDPRKKMLRMAKMALNSNSSEFNY